MRTSAERQLRRRIAQLRADLLALPTRYPDRPGWPITVPTESYTQHPHLCDEHPDQKPLHL